MIVRYMFKFNLKMRIWPMMAFKGVRIGRVTISKYVNGVVSYVNY